jgi:hypothetical protein
MDDNDNEDNKKDAFLLEYLLGNDDDNDDDNTFFLSVMASIVSKQQQCLKQEHELLLPKRSRKSFYIRTDWSGIDMCKSLPKKDHMPFHASIVCRNLHLSSSLNLLSLLFVLMERCNGIKRKEKNQYRLK